MKISIEEEYEGEFDSFGKRLRLAKALVPDVSIEPKIPINTKHNFHDHNIEVINKKLHERYKKQMEDMYSELEEYLNKEALLWAVPKEELLLKKIMITM